MNRRIIGVVIFGVALLFGLQITMEHFFDQRLRLMTETMAETEQVVQEDGPEVFAVFGIDQEQGNAGRSDCIMLLSMEHGTVQMCSIARDTLVTLPGQQEEIKLGHAYAFGGAELAMETLNENFGLNMEHYVSLNFTEMEQLVELLGGVDMQLTEAEWRYMGLTRPYLGHRHLTGQEALQYSRIRSIDSDDARTARQRKLVMAMARQVQQIPKTRLPELVVQGMKSVSTNVDILTLMDLGKNVLSLDGEITFSTMALPGDSVTAWGGTRRDGVWYYVYDLKQAGEQVRQFFYGAEGETI